VTFSFKKAFFMKSKKKLSAENDRQEELKFKFFGIVIECGKVTPNALIFITLVLLFFIGVMFMLPKLILFRLFTS
jgi:hypothetical protein